MLISNTHKFIFIHLYKCAGTSIGRASIPTLRWNDLLLGNTSMGEKLSDIYFGLHGLRKHSSAIDGNVSLVTRSGPTISPSAQSGIRFPLLCPNTRFHCSTSWRAHSAPGPISSTNGHKPPWRPCTIGIRRHQRDIQPIRPIAASSRLARVLQSV